MTIVNDDSRVINKHETSLTDNARVVIYDCYMFIVQATGLIGTFKFDSKTWFQSFCSDCLFMMGIHKRSYEKLTIKFMTALP